MARINLNLLKSLWPYVRSFGLPRGIIFFWVLRCRSKFSSVKLDSKTKFYMRPRTSDVQVFESVFLKREYEIDLSGLNPRVILDVGANIVATSVFFARRFPDATIIAIEPEGSNYELLKKNASNYSNIKTINAAIWHKSTNLCLENPNGDSWSFYFREVYDESKVSYPAVSIGDLCDRFALEELDIVKVDIEGGEKDLFSQNYESWLPQVKILIIELHDRKRSGTSRMVYTALTKFPFDQSLKGYNSIFYNREFLQHDS